jgi:hypothetical protein
LSIFVGGVFGVLLSRPADVGFVMAASSRELAFDWPCDSPLRWSIAGAQIEFPEDLEDPPVEATDIAAELQRAEVALVQTAPDALAIEIGPSRWNPPAAGQPAGTLAWTAKDGEEKAMPLGSRVRLIIALTDIEQSFAARGIFRFGGSVSDHASRSRLLLEGRIIGRDLPTLGGQRQTFLDESVEPGGVMLSHPDLEEALIEGRKPAIGWVRWCTPQPGEEPDYAVGAIRLAAAEPQQAALGISLFRRTNGVGVQTLGAVAGGDSAIVRFSVTMWSKWIAAAWLQTGLVVVAALLTLFSAFYGGLQALQAGREPPDNPAPRIKGETA